MPDGKKTNVFSDGTGLQSSEQASPEDIAKWQKKRASDIANANKKIQINGRLQQFNTKGMVQYVPGKTTPEEQKKSTDDVKAAINAAKKHIAKVREYEEYLEYLKSNPSKLNKVLAELEASNPTAWIKLQKYPQFQSLGKKLSMAGGAGNTTIGAVVGALGSLVQGKAPTGVPVSWAENTLKDMMKREGFGSYSKVLGGGSSTLPAAKEEYFSNSRYGEHRKIEVPRLEKEYGKAAAASKVAARGVATAVGVAVTRVATPFFDIGLEMLKPETGKNVGVIGMRDKLDTLAATNPALDITSENYAYARMLLNKERYAEFNKFVDAFK